jgi:hypothetical protein
MAFNDIGMADASSGNTKLFRAFLVIFVIAALAISIVAIITKDNNNPLITTPSITPTPNTAYDSFQVGTLSVHTIQGNSPITVIDEMICEKGLYSGSIMLPTTIGNKGTVLGVNQDSELDFITIDNKSLGIEFNEQATITQESSTDTLKLYANIDGFLHYINDVGVDSTISNTSGGEGNRLVSTGGTSLVGPVTGTNLGIKGLTATSTKITLLANTTSIGIDVNGSLITENVISGSIFAGSGSGTALESTAVHNTFYGTNSGATMTTSNYNTFIGSGAGRYTITANNVALGYLALNALSNASSYSTIIGAYSATTLASGTRNTIVGVESGTSLSSGSYNTFLGANADVKNEAGAKNYRISVGYQAICDRDNHMMIGSTATDEASIVCIKPGRNNICDLGFPATNEFKDIYFSGKLKYGLAQGFSATTGTVVGNAVIWDPKQNQVWDINVIENVTITISATIDNGTTYLIRASQLASSNTFTIAFLGTVKWTGGVVPIFSPGDAAAPSTDIYTLVGGPGNILYGTWVGNLQ